MAPTKPLAQQHFDFFNDFLKAKVNLLENSAYVEILDQETGISPGQACVFYSKNNYGYKVLGGGWIKS